MTPWWMYGVFAATYAALCWLSIYRRHMVPKWLLPAMLGTVAVASVIKMLVKATSP
jgi:hypothetical protein